MQRVKYGVVSPSMHIHGLNARMQLNCLKYVMVEAANLYSKFNSLTLLSLPI